jgi:hypothetical protein
MRSEAVVASPTQKKIGEHIMHSLLRNFKVEKPNFTFNERLFLAKIYDYIFDKGMKKALDNGTSQDYMDQKLCKCLTNPTIKKLFKTYSFDAVQMYVIQYAVHYAPLAKVSTDWLKYHQIHLVGKRKSDNKVVGLFDYEISE